MSNKIVLAAALAAGLFAGGSAALASETVYHATLNGASEVPGNDSKATGTATATFDTGSHMLKYTVSYSGLSGPATMGHIHAPAKAGKNAPVVIPFKGSVASPINGEAKLDAKQIKQLEDGMMYVNIHTKAHPGGEIRGQLMK